MSAGPTSPLAAPDSLLRHVLPVLWRGRWIIAIMTLGAIVAGVLYLRNRDTLYTATAQLYIEPKGPRIIGTAESMVMAAEERNYVNTQAELIRSIPILKLALESPDVRANPIIAKSANQMASLKGRLRISVGKADSIVSVGLVSAKPVHAAQLVNRVVDAYVTFHSRSRRDTAEKVLDILVKEKERYDKELATTLDQLTKYKQKHGQLAIAKEGTNLAVDRLGTLSKAFTDARVAEIQTRASYESGKAMVEAAAQEKKVLPVGGRRNGGPTGTVDDAAAKRVRDLEAQLAKALSVATEEHPTVIALKKQLERERARRDRTESDLAEGVVGGLRRRWEEARLRADEFRKEFEKQEKLVLDLNTKAVQLTQLDSAVRRAERMLDTIDSRIREINVNEVDKSLNITILESARADTATFASSSSNAILAVALLLGLVLGIGLTWLRETLDQRVRTGEEVMTALELPVLGIVPRVASPRGAGALATWEKHSQLAEAHRSIRTALLYGSAAEEGKVLHVTSPDPADGKSIVTSNLAIAMARAGHHTLIIDADLRKPTQHRLFDVDAELGLTELLADPGATHAPRSTEIDGLDLLPSGAVPSNPAELLNSSRFVELLARLSEDYDRVLVDSPPVLPVADSRIIAAHCAGSVVVLRVDKSTRRRSAAAKDALLGVGARVLGVVVNDMPSGIGYGYGPGYGFDFGSGYRYSEGKGGKSRPA